MSLADASPQVARRPWLLALVWISFLTPVFFITYLGSLEIVSWRAHVPVILFDWEKHIPFLAWTVVPYWSIDALYGLSLFLCATRHELHRHALRLLSAQMVAVPIFLIAPLKLTSTIPADVGMFAPLFGALEGMVGKPFNLAPSLHIGLLVILWVKYTDHVPRAWHWAVHVWAILIGASVLTANQHHFFDVPTGAMLGFFCLWLWPDHGTPPLAQLHLAGQRKRWKLASAYALAAGLLLLVAWTVWGTALWLLWPMQSLLLVACAYAFVGPALFQKDHTGRMSLAAKWLLWPYILGARLNAWLWTRRLAPGAQVLGPVHIGRFPNPAASPPSTHVVDLSAELPGFGNGTPKWVSLPMLDLVTPAAEDLAQAASHIESAARAAEKAQETVLVCCALGFSRSAAAVVTWLAGYNHAADVDAAVALLRTKRPEIVLRESDLASIAEAVAALRGSQS